MVRPLVLPLILAVAVTAAACGSRSNGATVFVEDIPSGGLDDDRAYAVRLTVFEYANSAGGFVEYFAIDGAVNTQRAPYFATDACAYFGQGPIDDGEFRIDVDGPNGDRIIMQARTSGRRNLAVSVVRDAGLLDTAEADAPPLELTFVETDRVADRACP